MTRRYAQYGIVDDTGSVVAGPTSWLGACRKISAAADGVGTWRGIDDAIDPDDPVITVDVLGSPVTYEIVPWSEVHQIPEPPP